MCVADDPSEARRTALRYWPNGAMRGAVLTDLARPADFESLATLVTEDAVARAVVCGADPDEHLDALRRWVAAGYDTVYVHQVGPDQEAMLSLYAEKVVPRL